jgi:hypothetical protein
MTDQTTGVASRQPRFDLEQHQSVTVTVCDHLGLPWYTAQGRLVNLSQNGARLVVDQEIPLNGTVRIKLALPELGLEFYVGGAVCWIQPADQQQTGWIMGCSLRPGVPQRLLSRMAQGGVVERRFEPRSGQKVPVRVHTVNPAAEFAATLHNYSRGGFCLETENMVDPGQELELHLTHSTGARDVIGGTLRWALHVDNAWLAGCAFRTPDAFDRLSQCCPLE